MIHASFAEGVATIALDRGAARNALANEGWVLLAEAIAAVPADATVVVLRSAVAGVFCAGADFAELARLIDRPAASPVFRAAMRGAIDALAALSMPSVAVVEGGCFGAGVALALAADLRVATPAARFGVPPARLGIGYPAEDVARLAARVGQGQAARLLFGAETIDAAEALRIGLVERVVDDADAVVARIAANDRAALRVLKAALVDPGGPGHAAAFDAGFSGERFAASVARYRG